MHLIDSTILKKTYIIKTVYALCLVLSTTAIYIAYLNPSRGYELSIYESTPLITWMFLILSVLGVLSVIMYQVYLNQCNNYCFMGIFILLFNRVSLLSIPFIRGYYSWRGDNISHIGSIISISQLGFIPSDNTYPITHLFLTSIYVITELPQLLMVNYSTALFSIFYVISIYLLATAILSSKKAHILAVSSVAVVFLSSNTNIFLFPNGWSIFYIPFAMFLCFKSLEISKSPKYNILFVIVLVMYPFFHPLSSIFFTSTLLVINLITFVYLAKTNETNYYNTIKSTKKPEFKWLSFSNFSQCLKGTVDRTFSIVLSNKYRSSFTAVLIELAIFLPWILSFQAYHINLRLFYNSVLSGSTPDVIESMQGTLDKINITGMDFIELLIKVEGAKFIFIFLFAISLVVLAKNKYELQKNQKLIMLSMVTVFSLFLYAAYLFGTIPGLQAIATQRIIFYLGLFTPISAGFVFSHLLNKKIEIKKVNIIPLLCVLTIFVASTLSIYSVFPSPNVSQPTVSVTQMDIKGTEWVINHYNREILTTHIMSPIYRFIGGVVGSKEGIDMLGSRYRHIVVPDHFNYTTYNKLGESYLEDRYMMITMFDTVIYDTVWSVIGSFNDSDFEQLLNDSSVEKLYSNGESVVFYIHTYKTSA
jgi:hypothetical protein